MSSLPDEENPFAAGYDNSPSRPAGYRPSIDHSIEHEPHLQDRLHDPGETEVEADLRWAVDADLSEADNVEHTVWDEPALSPALSGHVAEDQLTYANWLDRKIAETTTLQAWLTTVLVAFAAGPWGIVGAIIAQFSAAGMGFSGVLGAVILAPVTEEITKIAAALWIVEKRPFRFKTGAQLILCAAAGGLVFAVIENLIYLFVYNPGGGADYALFRWTVCTALHVTCSSIAGVGLMNIWQEAIAKRRRPELSTGMPMFAAAMVIHGLYNAAATVAEASGILSFE